MKKIMVGMVLIASSVGILAASAAPTALPGDEHNSASGNGSMFFGKHGDSVGLIRFDVERGSPPTGSLLFAAEDHHRYPDIIVRMEKITRAKFGPRRVKFTGQGTLHDGPVTIEVVAFDGNGTKNPDAFSIECVDPKGKVVLKASGELSIGDIRVGEPS